MNVAFYCFKLVWGFTVADLRGAQTMRPLPRGPNSFNFMQFSGKFGKIVCWRPPGELAPCLGEILDPPLAYMHALFCTISIKDHGMSGLTNQRICHSVQGEGHACHVCSLPHMPPHHACPHHARPLPCMPPTMHTMHHAHPPVRGQRVVFAYLYIVLLLTLWGLYFWF